MKIFFFLLYSICLMLLIPYSIGAKDNIKANEEKFKVSLEKRIPSDSSTGSFTIVNEIQEWNPKETARDLLWGHGYGLYSKNVFINGKKVAGCTVLPENQADLRTLCHEMYHLLGAPDLYHYTNMGDILPVGTWDLMEYGLMC